MGGQQSSTGGVRHECYYRNAVLCQCRGRGCGQERYVRAYVKRNKTDAADAAALVEAARASDISPVRVKSVEQQGL